MTTAAAVILGVVLSVLSPGVHAGQGEKKAGPMGDMQWTASRARDK